jgi:hypothetical protein
LLKLLRREEVVIFAVHLIATPAVTGAGRDGKTEPGVGLEQVPYNGGLSRTGRGREDDGFAVERSGRVDMLLSYQVRK